jgi:hypothetical protein
MELINRPSKGVLGHEIAGRRLPIMSFQSCQPFAVLKFSRQPKLRILRGRFCAIFAIRITFSYIAVGIPKLIDGISAPSPARGPEARALPVIVVVVKMVISVIVVAAAVVC